MIKQERKCGLKHDRHTKARCNERNERLMKIINADTIIDDGRLFNIKVIVHICYHDVITYDINEDVDEMIATLNRDYNNKASKNSHGSHNKTWSRTTPTYTTMYPAAATLPSTT